jgi:hypothetical protein
VTVNTPLLSVGEHPERLAPLVPVPFVIFSVSVELSVVTTFPAASSTETTGDVANAVEYLVFVGEVVNISFVAGPTVTLKLLLVAAESVPSVAVSV